MTAAGNLARWGEVEQAATEGPWRAVPHGFGVGIDIEGPIEGEQLIVETYGLTYPPNPADAAFIATARTAVPALLAFVDEVLALCDKADANPEDGLRKVHTATLRQAAEKHLGGVR